MCSYNKTQVSPYDLTKLAIYSILRPDDDLLSNCRQNFKKTVSFDKNVHFIDEEDIVTYEDFDCGFTFNLESPTKIRQSNRERNYISRSCEKSKCIPSNDRSQKGLRVSFAFFQRKYLPDGRMNETIAMVIELSDLWKPGAMDGTPLFLMICNSI